MACAKHEDIAEFFGLPKRFLHKSETQVLEAFFQGIDKDGDGHLTWEELKAWDLRKQSEQAARHENLKSALEDQLRREAGDSAGNRLTRTLQGKKSVPVTKRATVHIPESQEAKSEEPK